MLLEASIHYSLGVRNTGTVMSGRAQRAPSTQAVTSTSLLVKPL